MSGRMALWRKVAAETFARWGAHNAWTHSAALAFYTLFSLAPVLIVVDLGELDRCEVLEHGFSVSAGAFGENRKLRTVMRVTFLSLEAPSLEAPSLEVVARRVRGWSEY